MQRTAVLVIGVVAVVVVAVIGFILLAGDDESPPAASIRPSATASASVAASASASPQLDAELLDRRWTILFVGLDTDSSRSSRDEPVNADALMLVSVAADQSEVALVSLPRDTVDIPLPDGGTWDRKVNALYREEGIEALTDAMEALYDVPIDGYLALNMDDFAALVDAVGGVQVSPEEPLEDPKVRLDIEAGPQELDGPTAEAYVRTRVDQDYGRMRRQQEVIVEIIRGLADPDRDLDVRSFVEGLDSLETDLPMDQLPTLLEIARRSTDAELRTLIIEPPLITFEGDRGDGRGYILEADVEAIRDEVSELTGEE